MLRIYLLALCFVPFLSASSPSAEPPVAAVVETNLATSERHIRQLAFDASAETYFASTQAAGEADYFSLVFDKPVAIKSVSITTGKPDGEHQLTSGALKVSADGKTFEPLAKFEGGAARGEPGDRSLKAVRIHAGSDRSSPFVLREIVIESDPPVATFKYPIEFTVDVSDAPEMQEWAEKIARICERAYPMINEELRSEGYRPPQRVTMSLKSDYKGVAQAGGGRITGSVKFFKDHPDDVGAMVHETAHIVQQYRGRGNPGWLVEGVADYVRFFKFEPGNLGRIDAGRARYNSSYRVSAAFLAYLVEKYDKELVLKLNHAMREGKYREQIFQDATGKPLEELDAEWRLTLRK